MRSDERVAPLAHVQRLATYGHRVGDVDDLSVLGDLGDEVSRGKVIGDGHAHAEDQHVGVAAQELHTRT